MAVYRSVVEWQRPGATEWSCDSLLLLRFTPELLQALQAVAPTGRVAAMPAGAGRTGAVMTREAPAETTTLSYAEVEQAQAAYRRVNGTPSSGLGAVLAQLQGLRNKGLTARFVYWQSEA